MTATRRTLLLLLLASSSAALAQQDALLKACKTTKTSTPSSELTQAIDDIRLPLQDGRPDLALNAARALIEQYPNQAAPQTALAELYLHSGDLPLATNALNQSLALDRCSPHTHLVASRLLSIIGQPALAAQHLILAHQLDPKEPTISEAWKQHIQPQKPAKPECRLTSTATRATLPLQPRGMASTFRQGAELDVTLNGIATHLVLDTGDPAITLSAEEAQRAGLTPEHTFESGPHTATGSNSITAYTSHIHKLHLGPITLEDCPVNVVVDPPLPFGGGIGLQLLHDFLLTLDIQSATLTLDPLPPPPASNTTSLTSITEAPIPETLHGWLPFYDPPELNRIVIPTRLNNAGTYLFLLDTGAPLTNITPEAARERTTVTRDFETRISGYGGQEAEVYRADRIQLRIGPISRRYTQMLSLPNATRSNASDLRISGILGFDWLRNLILRIDYRDQRLDLQPHP